MALLLLLTACRPDPTETWRAAQLKAERGRAAVASADDVCRQIYRCEEARTRLLRAEAAGQDELEASGLVNGGPTDHLAASLSAYLGARERGPADP
ncbi:MAG: hypothetical protein Q8P18_26910 [Pseudomonadota bacterium]|nr:hypothetical protein [Pseudomonadota bacterium]